MENENGLSDATVQMKTVSSNQMRIHAGQDESQSSALGADSSTVW